MSKLVEILEEIRVKQEEFTTAYEKQADDWWESLPMEQRELAFYSVVKRIYDGDIKQGGSYRYVLYDVFGFDPGMYGIGMDCGYMELHNSIVSADEKEILNKYYERLKACANKDEKGNCPLHNLHCQYPECEKK